MTKQDLTSTAQQLEQKYAPDSINWTYGLIMCHKTCSDKLWRLKIIPAIFSNHKRINLKKVTEILKTYIYVNIKPNSKITNKTKNNSWAKLENILRTIKMAK